jgi:hypothetical protein
MDVVNAETETDRSGINSCWNMMLLLLLMMMMMMSKLAIKHNGNISSNN